MTTLPLLCLLLITLAIKFLLFWFGHNTLDGTRYVHVYTMRWTVLVTCCSFLCDVFCADDCDFPRNTLCKRLCSIKQQPVFQFTNNANFKLAIRWNTVVITDPYSVCHLYLTHPSTNGHDFTLYLGHANFKLFSFLILRFNGILLFF